MIGRADDYGIHVLVGQQLAIIHVGLHLRVPAALDALLPMRTVNVAHGDHLDPGHRHGGVDEVAAPGAEADAAHADGFVRGLRRQESRREGRGGCQSSSGLAGVLEELPTG